MCSFASREGEWYVVVGTGKDVVLGSRANSGGSLILYQVCEDGRKLKYLHTTPMDDAPLALEPFNGRLLVGVGKLLRIYDIGKKKMLRKCENKVQVLSCCFYVHTLHIGTSPCLQEYRDARQFLKVILYVYRYRYAYVHIRFEINHNYITIYGNDSCTVTFKLRKAIEYPNEYMNVTHLYNLVKLNIL